MHAINMDHAWTIVIPCVKSLQWGILIRTLSIRMISGIIPKDTVIFGLIPLEYKKLKSCSTEYRDFRPNSTKTLILDCHEHFD